MTRTVKCEFLICALTICAGSLAGGESKTPERPDVNDADLQRVSAAPASELPWKKKVRENPGPGTRETDITSGDVIIKAAGDLQREAKKGRDKDGKEIDIQDTLVLNNDVEVEQLQTQSVLRGQKLRVVRNLLTGNTEQVQAEGGVEMITPELRGKGAFLNSELGFDEHNELVKNLTTIEGSVNGAKAVMWQGEDVMEAGRFVMDRRMNTFRATGQPAAVVTLPADETQKTVAKKPDVGGGILPAFSIGGSGKVRLQCDGEMYFEGSSGRMRLTRNAMIQQQPAPGQPSIRIFADETLMLLNVPPPGQPNTSSGVFSGRPREMQFNGRVEIHAEQQVILCDKATLNMEKQVFSMEMTNPKEDVRVFMKESADGGTIMISPARLTVNMATREFQGGGPLRRKPFTGSPESTRNPK